MVQLLLYDAGNGHGENEANGRWWLWQWWRRLCKVVMTVVEWSFSQNGSSGTDAEGFVRWWRGRQK